MSRWKKTLKAGLVAGLCGVGLCAVARKLQIPTKLADMAHSMEGVPFPGGSLYAFLTSRQMRTLYSEVAEDILTANHFERILDLGTGVGYLPIEIWERNPETHIAGIDSSPDMVRIAKANALAAHAGKAVDFSEGDPTNLPFPGRYFDLVVSVNLLHHWSDPAAVFEEVYHVLQPGGEFLVYDYMKEVPDAVWESAQCRMPLHLRVPFLLGPMASSRAAYTREELLKIAERTHFENPVIEERAFTVCAQKLPVFYLLRMRKPEQPAPGD
ncbi:MAG: class I SAM-dependent methyltransferase [Armatimonadota bacterium]